MSGSINSYSHHLIQLNRSKVTLFLQVMTTPTTALKKGSWSLEEDEKLISYINRYGIWNWSQMPRFAGLSRSGKSCRLRWMNYLKPNVKRGNFTKEEDDIILHSHSLLGNSSSSCCTTTSKDHDDEFRANYFHTGSPGTVDDLQCFWDQLCPVENLELGNNLYRNMFSDPIFQDSCNDPISSTYSFYNNDYNTSFLPNP
ncbi:Homeodomain-like protein [Cynara cardunculus var. scolymus]|uniref:Homeodomain-like protein n=1 Tax=Cynara cardunculus var. scolymus TaxID=59895 RepID=A0A103XUB6_CYNCS|nr:Homeodomain-like protein [Cynara cardunculus var. scolymus]